MIRKVQSVSQILSTRKPHEHESALGPRLNRMLHGLQQTVTCQQAFNACQTGLRLEYKTRIFKPTRRMPYSLLAVSEHSTINQGCGVALEESNPHKPRPLGGVLGRPTNRTYSSGAWNMPGNSRLWVCSTEVFHMPLSADVEQYKRSV